MVRTRRILVSKILTTLYIFIACGARNVGSDSKVNMEEVEKVVAAFKDVDSNIAVMSMAIVATVLRGPEIMLLISMFKRALSLAVVKTFKRMIDKND